MNLPLFVDPIIKVLFILITALTIYSLAASVLGIKLVGEIRTRDAEILQLRHDIEELAQAVCE